MNKIVLFACSIMLASCGTLSGFSPSATPAPTNIPEPTAIPTPTSVPSQLVDLKSGGFSLSIQPELPFTNDDSSVSISDKYGAVVISLNGKPYIESSYTIQSFLDKYVTEIALRGGTLNESKPYGIVVDGTNGIAVDLTGNFQGATIAGKAIAVSPGKDFIIFGLGMSNISSNAKGWAESGGVIFESVLASIKFKAEVKK